VDGKRARLIERQSAAIEFAIELARPQAQAALNFRHYTPNTVHTGAHRATYQYHPSALNEFGRSCELSV
jgi:hypothetical protein